MLQKLLAAVLFATLSLLGVTVAATGGQVSKVQFAVSLLASGVLMEPYAQELNDEAARYGIEDVSEPPVSGQFHDLTRRTQPLTRCRWYRFELDPSLSRVGRLVLYDDAESATLFEPTKTGFHAERFGSATPASSRRLKTGSPVVDILQGDYGRPVYVRVDGAQGPSLSLQTAEAYFAQEESLDFAGIFFGTIFGVLTLAASLFALVTRVRAFAYYSIYMVLQTLNQLNGLPFAERTLLPDIAPAPWMFDLAYAVFLPLSFVLFLRFALATKLSPILDRLTIGASISASLVGVACLSLDRYQGTSYNTSLLPLVYLGTFAVMSAVAFVRWRQHYVSAVIYLIGLLGVVVGFAAELVFAPSIDTPDIGFVWEALAFLTAIAYRLVQMTKDRESAFAETLVAKEAVAQENALRIAAAEHFNKAFSRFVPREFLQQLGRQDIREVELGDHVEREMTVLFCDIRAFVALSEQLTPEATFDFLNLYFGRVGPVVRANNGFVDKYVGDGVMALFPGSADDALRAAIALQDEVRRFNEVRARAGAQPIEVGVGLHRGRLMLATVGERERYDTTVIADVVNVAARLEGLTNVYGARIIVSEAVVSNALDPQAYNLRWLGTLRVLGSTLPTSAYEVCDGDPAPLLLRKRATASTFAVAMAAYRRKDYVASSAGFADLLPGEPQDAVAKFFWDRSNRRAELAAEWDGVETHDSKR